MRTGLIAPLALCSACAAQQLRFEDETNAMGLGNITASRVCAADLNNDGRPDIVIRAIRAGKPDIYRVFLNLPDAEGQPHFVQMVDSGLPSARNGDVLVFADLDNDGKADAIIVRYLDTNSKDFKLPPPEERTAWLPGHGDGTFGSPRPISGATPATSACTAVGDVNADGLLDLYIGNWYTRYPDSNEAFRNDLLIQTPLADGTVDFTRVRRPEDDATFDEENDAAGRPTYGVMILRLGVEQEPGWASLLDLDYGRRANRLWVARRSDSGIAWEDAAPRLHLDGDEDRSGKYPEWLKERAKTDKRFDRADEKPFRSHGNSFDASCCDADNDTRFDLFVSEITHAWAGPSSDRSRLLFAGVDGTFATRPGVTFDRAPADASVRNWNQGDLFVEMGDFDNDGLVDVLLSSGDYPDNQQLRLYRQLPGGKFSSVTSWCGIANEGSQQLAIADFDGDGDLDIVVGQSFNRLTPAQIGDRVPTMKVYMNKLVERRKGGELPAGAACNSLTLSFVGDPAMGVSRDCLGVIARVAADTDGDPSTPPVVLSRQLIGVGGHAGKQNQFILHFGLAAAHKADSLEITWPDRAGTRTVLKDVPAGRRTIRRSDYPPPGP